MRPFILKSNTHQKITKFEATKFSKFCSGLIQDCPKSHDTISNFTINSLSHKKNSHQRFYLLLQGKESIMENLCLRCPHIAEMIFGYLDNQSLTNSKLVSKSWYALIDNGRTISIRIIKKYILVGISTNEIHENWKFLMKRAPQFVLKELANFYHEAYTVDPEGCMANDWNQFPFHFAASYGLFQTCQHILVHKCYIDKGIKDLEGWTPLHHAAGSGHLEVCRLLLHFSEDKSPRNNYGQTPLQFAANRQR